MVAVGTTVLWDMTSCILVNGSNVSDEFYVSIFQNVRHKYVCFSFVKSKPRQVAVQSEDLIFFSDFL